MLQGLQSAGFSINEVIFVALGLILLLLPELQLPYYNGLKPLLLSFDLIDGALYIKFYINDIFFSKESP
jgi:hypothetical protein